MMPVETSRERSTAYEYFHKTALYSRCDTTMYIEIFLRSLRGQKANPKVVKLIDSANFNRIYSKGSPTDHNRQKNKKKMENLIDTSTRMQV